MNATEALNCQVDFLNSIISGMGSQDYKFIPIQCRILFIDLYEFSVLNYLHVFMKFAYAFAIGVIALYSFDASKINRLKSKVSRDVSAS